VRNKPKKWKSSGCDHIQGKILQLSCTDCEK